MKMLAFMKLFPVKHVSLNEANFAIERKGRAVICLYDTTAKS